MSIPLYEKIAKHIVEEIKSGRLNSGDRVKSEKELAEQFSVSRITSKKALDILAYEKIIERARGRGSFVSATLPDLTQIDRLNMKTNKKTRIKDKRRLVGLIFPDFADSFGTRLLYAIEAECTKHQSHLLIKRTDENRKQEEAAIRTFLELGVDGLIVMPVHGEHYNAELIKPVLDGFPVVLVDRYLKGIPACSVSTDNQKAAEELTNHLLEYGHEHIAFLSSPPGHASTLEERVDGYKSAIFKRGMRLVSEYCLTTLLDAQPDSAYGQGVEKDQRQIYEFVKQHPEVTAFVANKYHTALMLGKVLQSLGKQVPDDCSIVCFDSVRDPFGSPFFTHIEQDEKRMGTRAFQLLKEQWDGEKIPMHTALPYRFVKGRSVGLQTKQAVES